MTSVHVAVGSFDGRTSSARIQVANESYEVAISCRERLRPPVNMGDTWTLLGLLAAMRTGSTLVVDAPLSPTLAARLPLVQAILATWFDELHSIPPVVAPVGRRRAPRRRTTAQFFTGGVDSFATHRRHPEVDALLYIHDQVHDTAEVRSRVHDMLATVARDSGTRLVEFDYDIRSFLDRYAEWGAQSHGLTLAAVAALTSGEFETVLLPASHTYRDLLPWGSHPLLDPLLSGDGQGIVHDGADLTRLAKLALIAEDPVAMANLRVCWKAVHELNCSRCEKCLRTMIALTIVGAAGRARTFDWTVDLLDVRDLEILNDSDLGFTVENRDAAAAAGMTKIAEALNATVRRYHLASQGGTARPAAQR